MCLLRSVDALKANELANRLNSIGDPGSGNSVPELGAAFQKTNELVLRQHANGKNIRYDIEPRPVRTQADAERNEVHFYFDQADTLGGIPFVTIRAVFEPGSGIAPHAPLKNREPFLQETAMWPIHADLIKETAAKIAGNSTNERTRLESLLHWLRFESGIRQGIEPKGQRATRYGVPHTLTEKHGNCWDYSDVFVTLCRALGLPCRQVAGWQKAGGGHVWAEVYLEDRGWLQVNPTSGKTIGHDYVPLFTTSDGQMGLVYRSFPAIKESRAEPAVGGDGKSAGSSTDAPP